MRISTTASDYDELMTDEKTEQLFSRVVHSNQSKSPVQIWIRQNPRSEDPMQNSGSGAPLLETHEYIVRKNVTQITSRVRPIHTSDIEHWQNWS